MEIDVEILAASTLWDDIPTQDIPLPYRILATLGVCSIHLLPTSPTSFTVLSLWRLGIPIVLDGGQGLAPPPPDFPPPFRPPPPC